MIIIQLIGGLGNQMFQYAAAKALAIYNNSALQLDITLLKTSSDNNSLNNRMYELDLFENLSDKIADNKDLLKFNGDLLKNKIKRHLGFNHTKIYSENQFGFSGDFFKVRAPALLKGYFQSEKYFLNCESEINKRFEFPDFDSDHENQKLLDEVVKSESVSIHVRRGDYLIPAIQDIHGLCNKTYYLSSIEFIKNRHPGARLYFFSDDQNWVKENFEELYPNSVFVHGNVGKNSWKDMCIMSNCKHNIIANSSFSWWAAWLNTNQEKIIIAPKQWFKIRSENHDSITIIPTSWLQL